MQQCEHGLADAKDDCIECWKARVKGLEAECDADLKANLGLNEECNRLIEESAKLRKDYRRIEDHWRDSVKECEDWSRRNIELVQENAKLRKMIEIIASGILPNGDHVEGAVWEYAREALACVAVVSK